MAGEKLTHIAFNMAVSAILLAAVLLPVAISDDSKGIPAADSEINSWLQANVQPYTARKGTLDANLEAAEAGASVIKVRKDGSGDFTTINDAIKSIPNGNTKRVIVWIGGGDYNEKIKIERTKPFVTLYGSPDAMPRLTYSGTALQYGTVDSATLIAESDYFVAANVVIENSSPRPDGKRKGAQAVALRVSGDKSAFFNCRLIGFQDTLCDDKGRHFFQDCYIEGTVDFIFGSGKSLYLNTELRVLADDGLTVITAQARELESEDTGYSFVHCKVTGTGTGAYLGRAWKSRPRVVFAYTTMSSVIAPGGWTDNFQPDRDETVFFGEYQCSGPGASPAGRAKFTKQLTDAQAQPFITLDFIEGSKWLLPAPHL